MKWLALLLVLVLAGVGEAQCVGEVKAVKMDEERGSIIVETEYTLNGKVVQTGRTRYLETSGTAAEIVEQAKVDVETHCKNLVQRIDVNTAYINEQMLIKQKALTQPIIDEITDDLVGQKKTISDVEQEFKGITIKVTADEKNSVSASLAVEQ